MSFSFTNNSILIHLFNANDLKNYSNKTQIVLDDKRINITLISETHFTKYSHIYISDNCLSKTNQPYNTAHKVATIYVKSTLTY